MRKKFTMLLASLFLVLGSAWAQTLTDGIYTIQADENGKRGYLAASSNYERPVLTEISWDAYSGNSCTTNIVENSKMWYIKTINGVSYLYNIGNGKFIIDNRSDDIYFDENPYGLNITAHNNYIHIGSGTGVRFLSMGCGTKAPNQVKWEKGNGNDGGCLLTLTKVKNGTTDFADEIAEANTKIEAFENPSVLFNKNSTASLPGTLENSQYTWKSSEMTAPSNFTTLRLTFMKTTNNAKDPGGYPHVNIAEFYLYDKDGNEVPLTADKFSSNATETNEGKSGLHRLCDGTFAKLESDGNNDWYWHSLWSSNAGAYHYLEINVADIPNLSTFAVGYVTRQEDGTPTELLVTTGSSTEVVAAKCPNVTVTYNHLLGGVSKRTEEFKTVVGASYPAPSLPWGVKVVTDLSGVVTEGGTKDIEVAYNGELPFTPSESFETAHWYYLKFTKDARYIRYNEADTYIPTDLDKIYPNVDPEAYAWAFVGDPYGEYKLMNRKAGSTKVLSSTRNVYDGDTGANTCPLMKEESGIDETTDNKTWIVDKSTSIAGVNGMFIGLKTSKNETKYMNSRGKLAFWTGGQGDGSTFQTEEFNYQPAFVVAKEEALKSLQALAAISDNTETAKTAIEALNPTTSEEALAAFTTLNEQMNSVVSGEYFTLQNKNNTSIYLTTDGTNASATTTVDIKVYWTLKNKNGLFYLYNKYNNAYLQAIPNANETKTTITDKENLAAAYKAVLPVNDKNNVWALTSFIGAGNEEQRFFHKAGDNRIVRWTATAEASQWTIAEVDYAAAFSALVDAQLDGKVFNENPALGEYPTSVKNAFDALKEAYLTNPTDENEIALVDCIDELEKAKNLPVFTIDGVISYAAGKSVYDDQNGAPNFKATNVYDKTMWWVFDQTTVTVGETESVNVVNYATRNGFWGAEALKITETSDANAEDGIFLFYTVGNNTPLHYQNDNQVIVRWDSKASNSGSATKFTYIGDTYDLDKLTDEHIAALPALQAAYNAKALYADAVLGEGLGQYKGTADDKAAIVATLAPAKAILNGTLAQQANTTVEEINAAAEAINNVAALEINLPEAGKFYRFQGACEASLPGYYITGHTNADGGRIALTAEADASTIYYFDGTNLTAYQSGLVVGLNDSHWTFASIADNSKPASTITFAGSPRQAGKYTIKSANRYFHYTVYNGTVQVNRCQDDVCKEHDWDIAEITELPVNLTAIGGYSWATLYAPVALNIPTGVTAYTGKLNNEKTSLTLIAIEEGGIIPAKTAVILQGTQGGSHNFTKTTTETTIEGNALAGTVATIAAPTNEGSTIYTLQREQEKDENGEFVPNEYTDNVVFGIYNGTNLNGFRAYLTVGNAAAGAIGIRFEGSTDIENVEIRNEKSEMIFDLLGRRVETITKGGIYIVNGKKVVIR